MGRCRTEFFCQEPAETEITGRHRPCDQKRANDKRSRHAQSPYRRLRAAIHHEIAATKEVPTKQTKKSSVVSAPSKGGGKYLAAMNQTATVNTTERKPTTLNFVTPSAIDINVGILLSGYTMKSLSRLDNCGRSRRKAEAGATLPRWLMCSIVAVSARCGEPSSWRVANTIRSTS